jgi:hypothetical protein
LNWYVREIGKGVGWGVIIWKIRTRHKDVESEVKNGKPKEVLLNIKRSVKENRITDTVFETSLKVCAIVYL